MPVYNSGVYLQTAIDSILCQSLRDIELILVDDGSTDGSSDKCDEYAAVDDRVVVIHQKNGGICNARNAALKIAKGAYIAYSDHDDEYLPGLLEKAYLVAVRENADILKFCKQELVTMEGVVLRERHTTLSDQTLNHDQIVENYMELLNGKVLECVWDGLYRREFLEKHNIRFDEFYKSGGEDIDYMVQIMQYVERFTTMHDLFYLHYARTGISTSTKFNQAKLGGFQKLAKTVHQSFKTLGVDVDNHKVEYIFQMMFTLVNSQIDVMTAPQCSYSDNEIAKRISEMRETEYFPIWFFHVDSLSVFRYSKKIGLSYFLFKHKLYKLMLLMFRTRRKQMDLKAVKSKR